MNRFGVRTSMDRTCFLGAVSALALGLTVTGSTEAALNILPMGDSITYGLQSTDGSGYRGPLQALLNGTDTQYDIVGTLQDGPVNIDQDHFGISGIKAHDFGNVNKSLLRQLQIQNVFPTLSGSSDYPDVILLHIGSNSFNGGGGGDPAGVELDFLLQGLTETNPASDFYMGADGDHDIIVARIIPKAGSTTTMNTDGGVYSDLTQHQARVKSSFDYNYGGASNPNWANGIESVITSRTRYLDRISMVDMFRIDMASLNLEYLLNVFGGDLGITTTQEMYDILSPEDDTLHGNAYDVVDWVLNYDEFNNTFGAGTDGVNLDLYAAGDTIHPSDLGYAIMAQVWFNAGLEQLLGDINGDGFVGLDDLNIVLINWNQTVTVGDESMGDLTNDGYVGLDDLDIILSNWNAGVAPPPSVMAIVPEPATLSLMALTGVAAMRRRVR